MFQGTPPVGKAGPDRSVFSDFRVGHPRTSIKIRPKRTTSAADTRPIHAVHGGLTLDDMIVKLFKIFEIAGKGGL